MMKRSIPTQRGGRLAAGLAVLSSLSLSLPAVTLLCPSTARAQQAYADHYSAGVAAFNADDFLTATEELKAALLDQPDASAALYLGNAYLKLGQLEEAKAALELVLQLDPDSPKHASIQKQIDGIASSKAVKYKIATTPPGASIFVDVHSGARGKSPVELSLPPGKHKFFVELEGYEAQTVSHDAKAGAEPQAIDVALKAKGCDLSISATPAEATARVDGGEPQKLPATVRVRSGEHTVTFGGPGLAEKTLKSVCQAHAPQSVEAALEVLPHGTLSVRAVAGMSVTVDWKAVTVEQAANMTVLPDDHNIEIAVGDRPPWQTVVKVVAGAHVEVVPPKELLELASSTGLTITAEPANAELSLDGKAIESGALVKVPAGRHRLRAKAAGYRSLDEEVVVKSSDVARFEVRLTADNGGSQTPLALAVAATVLAAGAEGLAIGAYLQSAHELDGSTQFEKWRSVEVGAQVAAGTLAVGAAVGYAIALAGGRSTVEKRADRGARALPVVGAAVGGGGGSLTLSGTF